jgi:hypothetical protein
VVESDFAEKLGCLADPEQPCIEVSHDGFRDGFLGGGNGFLYDIGQPMLRGITVLNDGNQILILEILERLEGAIVLFATDQVMGIIDCMENLERLFQSIGGIGNVLADCLSIHKSALLFSELLGARLNRLIELQNLGGQGDSALPNMLKAIHRIEKLFMLGKADALDLGFAVFVVSVEALCQYWSAIGVGGVFQDWDQLVKEIGVGRGVDNLKNEVVSTRTGKLGRKGEGNFTFGTANA